MPIFQYVATDQTGAQSQGNYEAANEEQAYAQLAQYGLTVTQLVPVQVTPEVPSPAQPEKKAKKKKEKAPKPPKAAKKKKKGGLLAMEIGGGPTNEDISIFTRQMSTLVHAGLPLLEALKL